MRHESTTRSDHPPNRQSLGGRVLRARPMLATAAVSALLVLGTAAADRDGGNSPVRLRRFIEQQVGGLNKLMVPADNVSMPVPREADGSVNPRYRTTEAKRFLGKRLFHDPVQAARIDINQGVPLDPPAGTAFGGCNCRPRA
jgi:hypothetical protein